MKEELIMLKKIDLIGQKFGRLVVLEDVGENKHKQVIWKCQCQCEEGNIVTVRGNSLRSGNTKSCGCFNKEKAQEKATKHGQSKSPIYRIWHSMLNRCYNPNNSSYHNYGGRGIKVCEKWWNFETFYEDIGKYRPEGKSIERISNDSHYEINNCKWATVEEQSQNRRAKGYSQHKKTGKYCSRVAINKKQIHLGCFDTPEEARKAYIEAKWKYHGIWLEE